MDKKNIILIAILGILFVGAIIKMCICGPFQWEVIAAGIVCGGYGIKRMLDEKTVGYVLVGACILLMIISLTGFTLS